MSSTSGNASAPTGAKWTVALLLVGVAAMLGIIIYLGWFRLIQKIDEAWAAPFAVLLTLIALLLARLIGVSWYEAEVRSAEEETGRRFRYGWLALYPFCFLISALGVINLGFYKFEGASVLTQNIDKASTTLSALLTSAQTDLLDKEYGDRFRAIDELLPHLHDEINNPDNCGYGQNAKDIVESINAKFQQWDYPNRVKPPSGSHTFCGEAAERLYLILEKQIQDLLRGDFVARRGPEKKAYLEELAAHVATAKDKLDKAKEGLARVSFASVHQEDAYEAARSSLMAARDTYKDYLEKLKAFLSSKTALPETLDISRSEELGGINTIIPTMLSGGQRIYFYVANAVALDFLVIYLFKSARAAFEPGPKPESPGQTDPQFLWTNPRKQQ
jgi:hypothetical protein